MIQIRVHSNKRDYSDNEGRFLHSSTTQAITTKLNYVKKIAAKHGYPGLTHCLNEQHQCSQYAPTTRTRASTNLEDRICLPVTFNPYVKAIYSEIVRKHQLQIAYRRCPTIFEILRNGKDYPVHSRLRGVYSIPLKDNRCNKSLIYIGSTKRSLTTRIRKHQTDLRHRRYTTALATFASDPEFDKADVIDSTPHLKHLKWLEAVSIYMANHMTTCINQKDEFNLSLAWQALINGDL
ncbi:uncharacterized protein LOC111622184 [Centruroides sculpturatus]|uniref:uncharacterized protein LOC111622184 n=1 Tax=Centruroides sculpturatus TaxID=218467 RepID=UPI000C6C9E04|nr:uncharacterized protein LOC111622184 [Centruroides sculpturatus]